MEYQGDVNIFASYWVSHYCYIRDPFFNHEMTKAELDTKVHFQAPHSGSRAVWSCVPGPIYNNAAATNIGGLPQGVCRRRVTQASGSRLTELRVVRRWSCEMSSRINQITPSDPNTFYIGNSHIAGLQSIIENFENATVNFLLANFQIKIPDPFYNELLSHVMTKAELDSKSFFQQRSRSRAARSQMPGPIFGNLVAYNTGLLPYPASEYREFVTTDASYGSNPCVFSIDCEMCKTANGSECTRVSLIDSKGTVVYETLVKPEAPIIDYLTRFSGITKELMDAGPTRPLWQVQIDLLAFIKRDTILIGHSIECDLKSLKMEHNMLVDTSIEFPHSVPGKRWSLRQLASNYLDRPIQQSSSGHDSVEDARASLDLMRYKLKISRQG